MCVFGVANKTKRTSVGLFPSSNSCTSLKIKTWKQILKVAVGRDGGVLSGWGRRKEVCDCCLFFYFIILFFLVAALAWIFYPYIFFIFQPTASVSPYSCQSSPITHSHWRGQHFYHRRSRQSIFFRRLSLWWLISAFTRTLKRALQGCSTH